MKSLLSFLVLSVACQAAESHLPPGTKALPSAAEKGRGPLALVNLFKWVDAAGNGAPVFAEPVVVKCAFNEKGGVFQRPDGRVIGLWIDKAKLKS